MSKYTWAKMDDVYYQLKNEMGDVLAMVEAHYRSDENGKVGIHYKYKGNYYKSKDKLKDIIVRDNIPSRFGGVPEIDTDPSQ